ncbi:sulfite exporter TauE/SafE family protein [Pseudonocardia saturnea]
MTTVLLSAALGLVVGVVIGGLGGGGGVLTVPALVYVLGQTAQDATAGSVVIVGITAVVGVLARARGGLVRWRTGMAFGAVGIPAAALGTLVNQRAAEPVLLLSFAALTVLAAVALVLDSHRTPVAPESAGMPRGGVAAAAPPAVVAPVGLAVRIGVCGVAIGFLTGFLGVGGGFLMVPVLVIVLRMPMTYAVGTSLLIIAINSVAAFATRAGVTGFDWAVLAPFTVAAIAGSFLGKLVCERLSGATLQRAFALLLLLVGTFVAVESVLTW